MGCHLLFHPSAALAIGYSWARGVDVAFRLGAYCGLSVLAVAAAVVVATRPFYVVVEDG